MGAGCQAGCQPDCTGAENGPVSLQGTSASTCIDTATPFAHTVEPEIAQNDDIPASAGATAKPTVAAATPENDIPEAAVQPHVAAAAKPEISFVQNDDVVEVKDAKSDITHSQNNNPVSVAAAAAPSVHAATPPTPSQTPHAKSEATAPAQSPGIVAPAKSKSPRPKATATKVRASPRDQRMGMRSRKGMQRLFGVTDTTHQPQSDPASHYGSGITSSIPSAQGSPRQSATTPPPAEGSQAFAPSDPAAPIIRNATGQCTAPGPTVENIRQLFSVPPSVPPPEAAEGSDATDIGCAGSDTSEAACSTHANKPMPEPQPSATLLQRSIVHGLDDMFDFWDFSFDKMVDGMSEDDRLDTWERLAMSLENDSLSTAYSGVRAPETAMSVMRYRLGLRLGREIKCNYHNMSHAIEWSPDAQAECLLSARYDGGGCVFGNIADFFRSELKDSVIPQLLAKPAMALEVLQPLLQSNRLVQTSAPCLVHGRTCCLKTCNRHIAGTSCRPFSKRGSGLGCNDQEIIYFMAWLGLRMLLQEPDVTQENVVGFPPDVIDQAVSSLYYMEVCELDAVQFGCACARRRQFIRLRHKEKILAEISPLSRFSARFFRAVKYHWSEQLVSRRTRHSLTALTHPLIHSM